jgi:hypothetical protein
VWNKLQVVFAIPLGVLMGLAAGISFAFLYLTVVRPLSMIGLDFFLFVPAVVFLISFIFRNDLASLTVRRMQFSKLYWLMRVVRWMRQIAVVFFFSATGWLLLAFSLKLLPPPIDVLRGWILAGGLIGVLYPLNILTNFVLDDAEPCLCFEQSLASRNYNGSVKWLYRGIDGLTTILKGFDMDVSSRILKFSIHSRLLKGESIAKLVELMLKSLLEITKRKGIEETHSGNLVRLIRQLVAEANKMEASGFKLTPSYRDRSRSLWELLSKSAPVITALVYGSSVVIILLLYLRTGQVLPSFIP